MSRRRKPGRRRPHGAEKTLDEREYDRHITQYGYPKDLSDAIEKSMDQVKQMIEAKEYPFDDKLIEYYYHRFLEMTKPVTQRI